MSITLPSKEICTVDVPEASNLRANFQYNFFVKDEKISEDGGIPKSILSRAASDIDTTFVQFAALKTPRMVLLSWKTPTLSDVGNEITDIKIRNNKLLSNAQNGSLIKDNLDSIVSEENFTSNTFSSITFCDGAIEEKLYYFISGSFVLQTLNETVDPNIVGNKAAQVLSTLTPKGVSPQLIAQALTSQKLSNGTNFYSKNESDSKTIVNQYFNTLSNVTTTTQINNKFLYDLTNRTIIDPSSPFSTDLSDIAKLAQGKKATALKTSLELNEDEYKSFVPFIDAKVKKNVGTDNSGAEIVGYIIDKFEISKDGSVVQKSPIIVDSSYVNSTADFRIKYDTTYTYAIRTVALFNIPAVDNDTGDVAIIKILVSSKPSNKVVITTTETVYPLPPSDVQFTWNYERINPKNLNSSFEESTQFSSTPGSLMIHWAFPINLRRDIKKFQVFRRKCVDEPFELIKVYDFDDSVIKSQNLEYPEQSLVEYLSSPQTFFFDDDFEALNKKSYIYAIVAINAHGYTSAYSAQFEVWFDQFKNKLEKRLISHQGAPKHYPNLYLNNDLFVDTIKVSGANSKSLKIYFNPEFYYVSDDNSRIEKTFETKQTGGSYKLSFINTDNQKQVFVSIDIDDKLTLKQENERVLLTFDQQK